MTVVIGRNPITDAKVDDSPANLLRQATRIMPGGGDIAKALDNHGIFDKAGKWISGKFTALKNLGSEIKTSVTDFITGIKLSDMKNPGGVWDRGKALLVGIIGTLVVMYASGVRSLQSGFFPMIGLVGFGAMMFSGRFGRSRRMSWGEQEKERRVYLRQLDDDRDEVQRAAQDQRRSQLFVHGDPQHLDTVIGGPRMWERRPSDPDFLDVRLGIGIQQTGLILTIYTFCIAVVPVLGNHPRMFIAYVAICFSPLVVRIALGADGYSYQLAGMLAVIVSLTTALARNYRHTLQRLLEHKLRADNLAAQLRVEKAAAEAARQEAEVANRAKTQFFAAASHDLRQPLHAMGLFAEALRQRSHDPEVAALVNSINESVDALEGLFGELLDITRIDTGGVDVNPAPVAMRELFARLRLHFEPTAFEKGLALSFRGQRHVAHADPVLLERILRNLVSNAIRYTDDGGVSCALRRDNAVWCWGRDTNYQLPWPQGQLQRAREVLAPW